MGCIQATVNAACLLPAMPWGPTLHVMAAEGLCEATRGEGGSRLGALRSIAPTACVRGCALRCMRPLTRPPCLALTPRSLPTSSDPELVDIDELLLQHQQEKQQVQAAQGSDVADQDAHADKLLLGGPAGDEGGRGRDRLHAGTMPPPLLYAQHRARVRTLAPRVLAFAVRRPLCIGTSACLLACSVRFLLSCMLYAGRRYA